MGLGRAPPVSDGENGLRREPRQAAAVKGEAPGGAGDWRWAPIKKPAGEGGPSDTEKTATQKKRDKDRRGTGKARSAPSYPGDETEKRELNRLLPTFGSERKEYPTWSPSCRTIEGGQVRYTRSPLRGGAQGALVAWSLRQIGRCSFSPRGCEGHGWPRPVSGTSIPDGAESRASGTSRRRPGALPNPVGVRP